MIGKEGFRIDAATGEHILAAGFTVSQRTIAVKRTCSHCGKGTDTGAL